MSRLKDLVKPVTSEEHFRSLIEDSERKLVIFDVHKAWCGPCSVMKSTIDRAYLDLEKGDDRIIFASCDSSFLPEEEANVLREKGFLKEGCKPLFLGYKHKMLVGAIDGADAPALMSTISENVFPVPEKEE
eukprot:TRINITY_DN776067_c0_g1_i1.p1 TRINITY_DN776067_c0_g1~~TRINITY_DN776067_c0_g1_i1.p1  ORF type:complete len:131 (+),score=31.52 TRINITY_DN776067_c0_g1_i1:63-455(+)